MLTKVFDTLVAFVFVGMTIFGATTLYNVVKRAALIQVSKGLSSTYQFTKALSAGKTYDWEKQP